MESPLASKVPALQPDLSCVVLSLGDQPSVVDAVRSLMTSNRPPEIVVVNSGGGDPTERLRAAGLDVSVVNRSEPLSPGAARNIGIDATKRRYVAFLAADCVAERGWVDARLTHHRTSAAVASAITNPDPENVFAEAVYRLLYSTRAPEAPPVARQLYGVSYDRRLFEAYGRFREDLPAGEDTDFNLRLKGHLDIAWAPDVRTAHCNPITPKDFSRSLFDRGRRRVAVVRQRTRASGRARVIRDEIFAARLAVRSVRRAGLPLSRRLKVTTLIVAGALCYGAGAITTPRARTS